jgi:PAS domain S-box-containing protein
MKNYLLFKIKLSLKLFLRRDFYYKLAPDDIMGKQRYKLFRTFTIAGALISLMVSAQAYTDFNMSGILPASVLVMFPVYILNYFLLQKHKNTKVAYFIAALSTLLVLHFVSYFSGGIRNSGMIYLGAVILCSYMLLGSRYGKVFGCLALLNLVYFYFITLHTHLVTNVLLGEAIDNDFLVSGLLGIFFIAAQSNYLESSKNIVIQSITEAHEQLREKAIELRKLSLVASKTENGVIITDKNNTIEWVNDGFTRLSGYTIEEVAGRSHNKTLMGPLSDMAAIANLEFTLAQKLNFSGELLQYHKDGSTYWVQINITPIIENGEVNKYIYIESNITEKKEAEEKMAEYLHNLEKTNKELDQFAYVVSHDLKAPLRAIGNLSSWIEEDLGDAYQGDIKNNFNIIKGRVERMENLINGILDYSRATRREGEESSVPVELLLKDTLELLSPPANFKIEINKEMPILYTERTKLQQVFANLIDNAFKHNDKLEGSLKIYARELPTWYEFTVEDNGPGIEKMYHDKIFVIFQVLQARDHKESTGVGLAIVKKIIDEMGASIQVESNPGEGARFIFTWPKKEHPFAEDANIVPMLTSKAA